MHIIYRFRGPIFLYFNFNFKFITMLRFSQNNNYNPNGFIFILSPIWWDKKHHQMRASCLTSFIDTSKTWPILNENLTKNIVYNGMFYYDFWQLNIINIWDSEVRDIHHPNFTLPIKKGKDQDRILDIYNIKTDHFFFSSIPFFFLKDFSTKDTICFIETNKWSDVVLAFQKMNIFIAGTSTNQRHIYNSLHNKMSRCLNTLFGRYLAEELSHFNFKDINIDYNPKFDLTNKESNKFSKIFSEILKNKKDIYNFILFTRLIMDINKLANVYDDYIVLDYMRFWANIINGRVFWEKLYYYITNLILEGKCWPSSIPDLKSIDDFKFISFEYNEKILNNLELFTDKVSEDNLVHWKHSNRLDIEYVSVQNVVKNMNINWDLINSINDDYQNYISTKTNGGPTTLNVSDMNNISINNKSFNPFLNSFQKRSIHTAPEDGVKTRYNLQSKKQKKKINIIHKDFSEFNISKYLESIKHLISDESLHPEEKQLKLENNWKDFMIEVFNKNTKNIGIYQEFDKKIQFLTTRIESLHKNKILKRKFGEYESLYIDIKWLFLSFSIIVTSVKKGYNATAINIGKAIWYNILNDLINQVYIEKNNKSNNDDLYLIKFFKNILEKSDKHYYHLVEIFNKNKNNRTYNKYDELFEFLDIDIDYLLSLGDFYLALFTDDLSDDKPLFLRDRTDNKLNRSEPYKIIINEKMLEIILNNIIINPASLPMICEPKEWKNGQDGGFLNSTLNNLDLVRNSSSFDSNHKIENFKTIDKTINHLNKIKFSVNNLLLNYLNNEGKFIIEYLSQDKEFDIFQTNISLSIAQTFSNSTFYLSNYIDWRGRIYNNSFYLNFQGSDLASALLQFNDGKKLNKIGKYYLYISIANNHNENNISKSCFNDRYNWVIDNYSKIINLDKDFILKADKKFNFTALALILKEVDNNKDFIVKQPVFLDATCSGIQHVAGLMRDFELASKTNLTPADHIDKPNDFYNSIVSVANRSINEYGKTEGNYNLANILLNRKILKASIMTKTYNVTVYGMKEQIKNNLKLINKEDFIEEKIYNALKDNFKFKSGIYIAPSKFEEEKNVHLNEFDIMKIAQILNEIIFVEYPSLGEVYNFFIEMAKLTSILNIPLTWITPSNLKITQKYLKTNVSSKTVKLFGQTRELIIRTSTDILNKKKQSLAIIPNIIHSLDASHLHSIILDAKKKCNHNILSIHDCFGTHPNDMNKLLQRIRKTFILQYSNENYLIKFRDRIVQSISDNNYNIVNKNDKSYVEIHNGNKETKLLLIPDAPILRDYDLNLIKDASYMIS